MTWLFGAILPQAFNMTGAVVKEFAFSDDEVYLKKLGYSIGTTIGEGSYAKVKSAYSDKLQKRVAMKIIDRRSAPKDFKEKFLPRELKCMKAVNHANCIKLFEIIEFEQKVCLMVYLSQVYNRILHLY